MHTLVLVIALGIVADLPAETTWTIASDGSVVELYLTSPTGVEDAAEDNVPQSMEEAMKTHHSPQARQLTGVELATISKRLAGPRHWHCPTCRSSSCLMYLGNHLRAVHKTSLATIDKVGYRNFTILHDNIHNANYRPGSTPKQGNGCDTCKDGECRRPIFSRLFSRRR